jgi:hypothetical protein
LNFFAVRKEELPHLKDIRSRESAAEALGKVSGEPGDKFLAIRRSIQAVLLLLDNAPADLPVGRGHYGVHRSADRLSSVLKQTGDVRQQRFVAGRIRGFGP